MIGSCARPGALLMAPMLTVKDDVKPPWLVPLAECLPIGLSMVFKAFRSFWARCSALFESGRAEFTTAFAFEGPLAVEPSEVQKFFKNVVAALLPTWPITPVKELTHFDFRIPEHGVELNDNNPLSLPLASYRRYRASAEVGAETTAGYRRGKGFGAL